MSDFPDRLLLAQSYLESHDSLATLPEQVVDLAGVLVTCGLGPVIYEQDGSRHGGLRRIKDRVHPVVYRRVDWSRPLNPRERFTVAHEIAHALVDERFELRPQRSRDYWALERVCDRYAARLLLPARFLALADAGRSPQSLLDHILGLAGRFKVSYAVAARGVIEAAADAAAWGISEYPDRRVVTWDVESPEVFGVRRPRRVDRDSAIAAALPASDLLVGEDYGARLEHGYRSVCRRQSGSFLIVVASQATAAQSQSDELRLFE